MTADVTIVNCGFYQKGNPLYVPLGPLYLTSFLEHSGITVDFRDYQLNCLDNPYDPLEFLKFLDGSSNTLGIGCTLDTLPLVLSATRMWKGENPQKQLILGGFGPTLTAEEILGHFPYVDAIVLGEGEETLRNILQFSSLDEVGGIVFSSSGLVKINPQSVRMDINTVPLPAYERIDWRFYSQACILASRGCPFSCTFCSVAPFWGNRITFRDAEAVAEEMELLERKYGQKEVMLCDDAFLSNREWLAGVLQAIRKRNLNISWTCWGRIDQVDEDILSELKASGCSLVGYGVESGSDAVLEKIKKNFTVSEVRQAVSLTGKYCAVRVNLMWGFPFETLKDFQQTCLLHMGLLKEGIISGAFLLAPMPQTELYRQYRDAVSLYPTTCPSFTSHAYAGYRKLGAEAGTPLGIIKGNRLISLAFSCYHTEDLEKKIMLAEKFFI